LKTKGIYFLYRVLQAFGLPILLLYFLYRGLKHPGYWRSIPQRLGFLPHPFRQTFPGAIWLHAVSVGEVLACVELAARLRREFPNNGIFVSTSTIAGWETADRKLGGTVTGVFFAPMDFAFAVRRVLRALQPSVVVVAETEIWPNLFREVKRTGAALMMVNGRISDRAFPRYQRFAWFFHSVLPAADSILAQTDTIRDRFLALGAPPDRTHTAGNLKYDFDPEPAPPDSPVLAYLERARSQQIWVAASTMPPADANDLDEDDVVIRAFQELTDHHPNLLLLLAPRKPERFDIVAQKLRSAGVPFVRRGELGNSLPVPHVLLLDTIGELAGLFAVADVVFMGGTLARRGGHNILEPALFAKPVILGPHMENFRDIAEQFQAAGASIEIAAASELAATVARLLDSPEDAHRIGRAALACAQEKRGATERAAQEVRRLFNGHVPRYRPATPWYEIRWILAHGWRAGARSRQAAQLRDQHKLDIPVISVGNLSMGGTGKTPCVLTLVEALLQRGHKPGILTRGYGRGSPEKQLILAPGAAMKAEHSGDEPQIFVRSNLAPVGIGIDRVETGRMLRNSFDIDIVVLDDGFQHLRLARNVDVVLIDALDPFGGGDVFPLGRLREPVSGLVRADLFLITRSDLSDNPPAIEAALRRINPDAGIFCAHVEPQAWVNNLSGREYPVAEPPFLRAGGFCGLGNPQSFCRTLANLGIDLVEWTEFSDHHRYRPHEVRFLAQNALFHKADALLTSQKDVINLCDGWEELVDRLPVYWLKIRLKIDDEDAFVTAIQHLLRHSAK